MMSASANFFDYLKNKYPELLIGLDSTKSEALVSENLISPFEVNLPKAILTQAQDIIGTLFRISRKQESIDLLKPEIDSRGIHKPNNSAIMMSYDFHLDESGNLKLIEVNTNASFLILGLELYEQRSRPHFPLDFKIKNLGECIAKELKYQKLDELPAKIAIIDENPESQRLYIEFLVAKQVFKSLGYECEILDSASERLKEFNFVYNRDTDFFLSSTRLQALKSLYENGRICLSPHPYEYLRLADKQRLIEWGDSEFQKKLNLSEHEVYILNTHIPKTYDVGKTPAEKIWSERKNLFFKPKRSFGSKQSYKGASMSRRVFDSILSDEFLAQQYISAPEITRPTDSGEQNFKYDLRCYAYEDQLQMIIARLYQGQVTNLRTPNGGFAPVLFA